jgi:hypothetical protein
MNNDLNKTRRKFNNKIEKQQRSLAKEGKSQREIHQALEPLRIDRHSELEIMGDTIQSYITDALISEARKLFLTIPYYSEINDENDEMWSGVSSIGERHLSLKGINMLKSSIREERLNISRERNERMKGWIQPITVLSGLIGTLIGLLAIIYQFYKH